ncbi:glycosyltransferase family 2 protein [Bradyrhizobium sp. CB2312]|uniref:glycosyltransferase family 2 protein n=1 Tax=Bradyrhizobium sp. CB2312 TaxID=3039155 RepID=UPI0024B26BF8|nr:glycosyltransferase family 2 protein [Bradyrhizobium sp. CB2312]WFU70862.1 glycosyltransferase family 2 protein [Bradyrhizobium sp. CB2312]
MVELMDMAEPASKSVRQVGGIPSVTMPELELTILMPCLKEAETLAVCIAKAQTFLGRAQIAGEVLIADNGSTDNSQHIAEAGGARVIDVPMRGYGAALRAGIAAARGRYIVMGDADDSYNFERLDAFLKRLRAGDDLVMGNRFRGGIEAGAMPFLHRYLGNPVLSWLGRLFFRTPLRDFHCGIRGFSRGSIAKLDLRTTGMEFASEMVVRATLVGLKISEVPTTLSKDGRSRPPHLRTWRDGWRHLRFLLLYSPRWLFFYPGASLVAAGTVLSGLLFLGPIRIAGISFEIRTMLVACTCLIVGIQGVCFATIARGFAEDLNLLPPSPRYGRIIEAFTLERLVFGGAAIFLAGIAGLVTAVVRWGEVHFGSLDVSGLLGMVALSTTAITVGAQLIFTGFLAGLMSIKHSSANVALGGFDGTQ